MERETAFWRTSPFWLLVAILALVAALIFLGGRYRDVAVGLDGWNVLVPDGDECWEPGKERKILWQSAAAPGESRLTFSEAEFNAYLACRLADAGEPYVKSVALKLLDGDRYEGRVAIDLGKPQASGLLPQKQDLLFAGRFESREGQIRVALDSLYLGTQPISPALIDMVIEIVSRLQGVAPTSLKDWYDLPRGVTRLETEAGRVVVVY